MIGTRKEGCEGRLGTLKIEIVDRDGKLVRVVEIEDPRESWVKYYNELSAEYGVKAVAA